MKQVPSDKYNVAWFKLADCITRGEKERALGVYRLLSHSLDDSALALQLHGDILLSFQDKAAHDKYKQAARLYQERNRLLEATAVYEHLALLEPDNSEIWLALIDLYQQLAIPSKVCRYVEKVLHDYIGQKNWTKAIELVKTYEAVSDLNFTALLHQLLVLGIATAKDVLFDTKVLFAHKVIDVWHNLDDHHAMSEFVQKIQELDEKLYNNVIAYKGS